MTDEQIIKALEYCCGNITFDSDCSAHGCYQASLPEDRNGDIRWCRQWLMKDTFDLANRQKAEINELKQKLQQAKFEAIKEFAERLKKEALIDSGFEVLQVGTIDNLVKEMTEAENALHKINHNSLCETETYKIGS